MSADRDRILHWTGLAAAVTAVSLAFAAAGLPAAPILAALAVGVAVALHWPGRMIVRRRLAAVSQATIGAALGLNLNDAAINALGDHWLPVLLTTLGIMVLSLVLGALIYRMSPLDARTATLAAVPGGAIGIVVMARDMGADDRIVAFNQYLRVLVILVATPLLTAFVLSDGSGPRVGGDAVVVDALTPTSAAVALGAAAVGLFVGRRMRLPGGSLLGPLILAAGVASLLPDVPIAMPPLVLDVALALVGLDVGLRFTRQSVRDVGESLPAFVLSLVILLAGCFAMAWAMDLWAGIPLLDGYLATTPGGLTVVAGVAYGSGADTGFIVATQSLRLVLMLLLAAPAVKVTVWLLSPELRRRRPARR